MNEPSRNKFVLCPATYQPKIDISRSQDEGGDVTPTPQNSFSICYNGFVTPYQTRSSRIAGSNYKEVSKIAHYVFKEIRRHTKRKPYIRSAYFKKEKIFLDYFWPHLKQRSWKERTRRLSYLKCAIELIIYSRQQPTVKINPNKKSETLYRFAGLTRNREIFYVQIKEVARTKSKYLMSVFPPE